MCVHFFYLVLSLYKAQPVEPVQKYAYTVSKKLVFVISIYIFFLSVVVYAADFGKRESCLRFACHWKILNRHEYACTCNLTDYEWVSVQRNLESIADFVMNFLQNQLTLRGSFPWLHPLTARSQRLTSPFEKFEKGVCRRLLREDLRVACGEGANCSEGP